MKARNFTVRFRAILLVMACGLAVGSAFAGGPIFGRMAPGGGTSFGGQNPLSARAEYASPTGAYYPNYGGGWYSPYLFPSFGGVTFSDEASNFFENSSYFSRHWWTGPNSSTDPRQAGYNPSAGYRWRSVGTLLVSASPAKAKVVLDGIDIGKASQLGPIQLPLGRHTLRVQSPGFKPSEIVINVSQPIVRTLKIKLVSTRS